MRAEKARRGHLMRESDKPTSRAAGRSGTSHVDLNQGSLVLSFSQRLHHGIQSFERRKGDQLIAVVASNLRDVDSFNELGASMPILVCRDRLTQVIQWSPKPIELKNNDRINIPGKCDKPFPKRWASV